MAGLDQRRLEEARRGLRFFWYGTRRGRRTSVVLGGVALALGWGSSIVCWFLAPSEVAMWSTFALTAIGLVLYAGVFAVLAVASGGVIGLAEAKLDERQLAERRRAYALAHRGSAAMLAVALMVAMLMPDDGDHFVHAPAAALFMFMLAGLTTHLILPHLVIGWRLPDPPDEDD
ncbi:hypothetical protein [Sphaerisporangium fuscum]|uniref:hypothetical protein n=1 Tax=Sphaerisporangium fuscum TaxID=2835868 RepID=UPI001BDC081B|nr:hypothetical protein [Sphaerisporangium fuscum]